MTTIEAQLRDIINVLSFIIEKTNIQQTDSVYAMMARLRESLITEAERAEKALNDLKARRRQLAMDRAELANQRERWRFAAAQPNADAKAKANFEEANAKYQAHLAELARVEAAIVAAEKKEAA